MVSELDKVSMEVAFSTMGTEVQSAPLIGGMTYGEQITINDIDAKLINTLGNAENLNVYLWLVDLINFNSILYENRSNWK